MTTKKSNKSFLENGKNYLIRTVTMIYTGKLEKINEQELLISKAAWIADTGRFSENLVSCSFNEVEMYPKNKKVVIGRGAILDVCEIAKLPTETK
jgi:hypothetical protein